MRPPEAEHHDVIIVGAGISGIGAACHLRRECPDKDFVILEARAAIGGTWDLFKYPGVRSDSDLHTYGYDFKPWQGLPIATGDAILRYMNEVVVEHGLGPGIRFGHRVGSAVWSSQHALWTVETTDANGAARRFTGRFLMMCQGYYNYQAGHRPVFAGEEAFAGAIIQPQQWPEDLDCTGKRVVVIGSGATAATIVPALARRAAHVTQLQRSPSYYLPFENRMDDELITSLRKLDLPPEWIHEIKRRKSLAEGRIFTERALNEPAVVREELLAMTEALLPPGFDIATHFNPRYAPWRERLCLLPEGDFLKAISAGMASIVTDEIERFVPEGIALASGQVLPADIIVTATGIELAALGGISFSVDDRPVSIPDTWTYKGIMLSGVPNLAWSFGYIRSSWTLRSDMIARYVCRLLNHMQAIGARACTPVPRPQDQAMTARPFVDPADFAPGYMLRGAGRLPKQGDHEPWTNCQDYYREKDTLPAAGFDDGVLQFAGQ